MTGESLHLLPCFCWDSEQDFAWGAGLREHSVKGSKLVCDGCGNEQRIPPRRKLIHTPTQGEIDGFR